MIKMSRLARDISLTLSVKFVLLFLLWFFCIKDHVVRHPDPIQWFLGSTDKVITDIKQ